MPKIRHRVFEIFDHREEALGELASKSWHPVATESPPESWEFRILQVHSAQGLIVVRFPAGELVESDTTRQLQEDFARLADLLSRDSKVLLDFTGVAACSPSVTGTLASFSKRLRISGSRMVLCCLGAAVQEVFFSRAAG